jgi:hypothetical protein
MQKIPAGLAPALLAFYASGASAAAGTVEAVGLSPREVFLAVAIGGMVACALISFFLAGRVSERTHVALAMLIALIGGFGLLTLLAPAGREIPIVGALIVLGLISLFKLMNQFEIRRKPGRSRN